MNFDSLVFSMMRKVMDSGNQLRIYQPGTERAEEIDGEIDHLDYWSTEGIVNVTYRQHDPDSEWKVSRKDYRFRPLSGAQFDDMFTIKKRNGVFTFMLKPKQEEELEEGRRVKSKNDEGALLAELGMAGTIALRTIRRRMSDGTPVVLKDVKGIMSSISEGRLSTVTVKDDAWLFQAEASDGWVVQAYMSPRNINALQLKMVDGTLVVSSREENEGSSDLSESEEPLVLSQLQKLWAAGKRVKLKSGKSYMTIHAIDWVTAPDGTRQKVNFLNTASSFRGTRLAGSKEARYIDRMKLMNSGRKDLDGADIYVDIWYLYDPIDGVPVRTVREGVEEPLLLSMLRKLEPELKKFTTYYQAAKGEHNRKVVTRIEFEVEHAPGAINLHVMQDNGDIWTAMLFPDWFDDFTIKSFGEGDDRKRVIIRKDLAHEIDELNEEVDHDTPLLVTQILKLLDAGRTVKTLWTDGDGDQFESTVQGAHVDSFGDIILSVEVVRRAWTSDTDQTVELDRNDAWTIKRSDDEWWVENP